MQGIYQKIMLGIGSVYQTKASPLSGKSNNPTPGRQQSFSVPKFPPDEANSNKLAESNENHNFEARSHSKSNRQPGSVEKQSAFHGATEENQRTQKSGQDQKESPRFSNSNTKGSGMKNRSHGKSKSPMRDSKSMQGDERKDFKLVGASPAKTFQINSSSSPFRAENPATSTKKSAGKTPAGKENQKNESEHETRSTHKIETAFMSLKELTKVGYLPSESQTDGTQSFTQDLPPGRSSKSSMKSKGRAAEAEDQELQSRHPNFHLRANEMEATSAGKLTEGKKTEGKKSAGNASTNSKKPGSEKKPTGSLFDAIQKKKESKEQEMIEEPTNKGEAQTEEVRQEQDEHANTQEARGKYSVAEDIKVIDYVQMRASINATSRNFWQRAVEKDNLLDKKRSIDSLRERYRMNLRNVTNEDLNRMRQWVAEHGEKGYITFKTITMQSSTGKITHVKKMGAIEIDTGNNPSNNAPNKSKSKQSKSGKTKATEKKPEGGAKGSEGNSKIAEKRPRTQIQIKFGQVQLPGAQPGHQQHEMDVEDIESVEDIEEVPEKERPTRGHESKTLESSNNDKRMEIRETSRNVPTSKTTFREEPVQKFENLSKRKDYDTMNQVDNAFPRKMNKENPMNQVSKGFTDSATSRVQVKGNKKRQEEREIEENLNQEAWLELQAERHNLNSEEVIDLFYSCSMNRENLIKYLEGEKDVAWNEDEDALLTGNAKEAAKKILVRFKGAANVSQREEFLERVEQLRSMLSNNNQKKQRAQSNQRVRDFF